MWPEEVSSSKNEFPTQQLGACPPACLASLRKAWVWYIGSQGFGEVIISPHLDGVRRGKQPESTDMNKCERPIDLSGGDFDIHRWQLE